MVTASPILVNDYYDNEAVGISSSWSKGGRCLISVVIVVVVVVGVTLVCFFDF